MILRYKRNNEMTSNAMHTDELVDFLTVFFLNEN